MNSFGIHDPSSAAYKKARRQHSKTTRNREPGVELDWSPFRAAEKRYRARFPPPDLSGVLDLATMDGSRAEECAKGGWRGRSDSVEWKEIRLKSSDRKGYAIPRVPGLVLLPAFISAADQKSLIRVCLRDQARHPDETNLDTHYLLPEEGLWNLHLSIKKAEREEALVQPRSCDSSVPPELPGARKLINNLPAAPATFALISSEYKPPAPPSPNAQPASPAALLPKLRWANIGYSYHWGIKQYDFSKGKGVVREEFRETCKRAVSAVEWEDVFGVLEDSVEWDGDDWRTWNETYEPDAGIVNFYQPKDTLMAHVDRSEVCATSPLVSISLGNAAVFLIGGLTREIEPVPILLRSGDVVIMSGPACRRAFHGVPRILNTLPSHLEGDAGDPDWQYYEEYIRSSRININVRQVFPKGFDPTLAPT